MIGLILGIGALFALSYITNLSLVKLLPSNIYPLLLAPGIALHELSHTSVAILTGAPVRGIQLFSKSGGYVLHERPRLPVLGQLAISFAPLVVGITIAVYLSSYLPFAMPSLSLASLWSWVTLSIKTVVSWRFMQWIIFYIFTSIILTLTPSRQDIYAATSGLLAFMIGAYIMHLNGWLHISVATVGFIWYINTWLIILAVICWPLSFVLRKGR